MEGGVYSGYSTRPTAIVHDSNKSNKTFKYDGKSCIHVVMPDEGAWAGKPGNLGKESMQAQAREAGTKAGRQTDRQTDIVRSGGWVPRYIRAQVGGLDHTPSVTNCSSKLEYFT